ncbi:MAG: nicotinate-nicotinamide nucleotide adenylyltransferase [Clostridia bacterium]|nr:nicotinate-nicotinamide nucleotide adenylyltransferase [Clostridia bacterium]
MPAAKRIVVLGGSFNPPTLAHFRLMRAALDGLDAQTGYYVPSSSKYVARKMKKTAHPEEVCPDGLRLDMLRAMCADDPRMQISDVEMAGTKLSGHTYETLQAIQALHPDAEVYFIFGADKMKVLPKWPTYDALTGDFRLLVFSRDGFDPEKLFAKNARLSARRDSFTFLPQPENSEDVSSTAVRDTLREGGDPSPLMHPGAAALLMAHGMTDKG